MSVGPEQRLNPEERANLAAYIDGELTEDESQVIATKLSLSAVARREVEQLKKTWEMLDFLPRPAASPLFPERTLSTVRALELKAGSWSRAAGTWLDWALRLLVCLAVAAASAGLGFALSRWGVPDLASRLVHDLSLAEHLEEYEEAGTFRFLEELAKSKEFGSPNR
jgi:anti-sigma factor RsiW